MKQMTSRSRTVGFALVAALALAAPGMALAGEGRPCNGHNGPCAEDVKALCPDANSRDEARRCLHEHADQVSPACAEKMAARHQRHLAIRNACESDLTAFCPDAHGRDLHHCLHEHRSDLSATCSQTLDSLHRNCSEHTPG